MSLSKLRYLLAGVVVAGYVFPASSQDVKNTQELNSAAGQITMDALTKQSPYQIEFVNLQAFSDAGTPLNTPNGARRLAFGWNIDGIQAFGSTDDKTWEENFGAPRTEIRWVAGSGPAPDTNTLWGLVDKNALEKLTTGLTGRGFTPVSGSSAPILGNGEAGAFDPTQNDPKNPWRGTMGAARFALPLDTAVASAPKPELLAAFGKVETLNQYAPMQAVIQAINEQEGVLMQAALISPVFGMQASDLPANFLSGKPEEILNAWQSSEKPETGSLPIYQAGAIVDLQSDTNQPSLVIALAFANCETAKSAIDVVSDRWNKSELSPIATELKASTVQSDNGQCVSVFQTNPSDPQAVGNAVASAINNAVISRSFNLLTIGAVAN